MPDPRACLMQRSPNKITKPREELPEERSVRQRTAAAAARILSPASSPHLTPGLPSAQHPFHAPVRVLEQGSLLTLTRPPCVRVPRCSRVTHLHCLSASELTTTQWCLATMR